MTTPENSPARQESGGAPSKTCDRKCVQKLLAKAKRKFPGADFYGQRGAVTMISRKTGKSRIGWPGLHFRYPEMKADGTPSKKMIGGYFGLDFCPLCGGALK